MKNENLLTGSYSDGKNKEQSGTDASLSRRKFMKQSLAASAGVVAAPTFMASEVQPEIKRKGAKPPIKITDLRCAIMGNSPVVRITTDQGIEGY